MGLILDFLLDLVFPCRCVVCGRWEADLCESCFCSLRRRVEGGRKKRSFVEFICLYDYRDKKVMEVIKAIKFGFNNRLIKFLLEDVERLPKGIEVIVPVPLFRYRLNWRGFNQAEEMAKVLGKRFALPVENILRRVKSTAQQSRIKDKRKRAENLRNAFGVAGKVRYKSVLLVDDVYTSGTTMKECVKTLRKAGVDTVCGLVLAE